MKLPILLLLSVAAYGQTMNGLGFSSRTCVDVDGDGYGTGPLANLVTTTSTTITGGALATITLGAVTGLQTGQRIRIDSSYNMELVTLTAVSGSTVTGFFLIPHASGVTVSAGTASDGSLWFPGYAHDDPGCLGLDADDRDATVHTAAQGITKYGSLALLLAKLGRDWQTYETDTAADVIGSAGQAAAASALLQNPAHTYYLAPATPSAGCTGTTAQCTGVAYPTNNCITVSTPCLTISNLVSAGYSNTGVGGDLIIVRDGWNNNTTTGTSVVATFFPGSSTRYNGIWSYPGEHGVMTAAVKVGPPSSCSTPTDSSYNWINGLRLKSTASQFGGAIVGGSCIDTSPGYSHDILVTHNEGTESDSSNLAPLTAFNAINNWTVAYNVWHDDNCPSGCNTPHGIYMGDHDTTQSTYFTLRRNLIFRNSYNGLHWNGHCTGCYFDQNVAYDNGIAGLDVSSGFVNSYMRGNISFNNQTNISLHIYNGACGQGDTGPCPGNITGNVIENNTSWHTGNINITNPGNNGPDAGCPAGINYCHKYSIFFLNDTSPATGNFGSNTLRNNIITSYGHNNSAIAPPVYYSQNGSMQVCNSTCTGWANADTYDHNIFYQTDANGGANVIWAGAMYTNSTASSITTYTNNQLADPQLVAENITNWNNESYFDFRLGNGSPGLHAGSSTGIPNFDIRGHSYMEDGASIGAYEQKRYGRGWTTLTGAGISATIAPPNGAPTDLLTANVTTTSTSMTVVNGAPFAEVGNVALMCDTTPKCQAFCIGAVSGTTITPGVVGSCTGTSSADGWAWLGTSKGNYSLGNTTIYYNTIGASNSTYATTAAGVYPFQTQFQQINTLGAGWDCSLRDNAGKPRLIACGGGGHSNYIGNELYGIYPNKLTPTSTRLSGPSTFAIAGNDVASTYNYNSTASALASLKDGTWTSAHIEANFADNGLDGFCKFGGGYAGGNGLHSYDTNCYAYASNTWSRFAGSPNDVDCSNYGTGFTSCAFATGRQADPIAEFSASGFSGLATYDPLTQTIWELWGATGGNGVLTQYYPAKHQHVTRASSQPSTVCCGLFNQGSNRVFISDRRWLFYTILNGPVAAVNTSGTAVTWVSGSTFTSDMISVWINNVPYAVASVGSSTSLTLASSAGTLSGAQLTAINPGALSAYKVDISGVTSTTPTSSPNPSTASVTIDSTCYPVVNGVYSGILTSSPGMAFIPAISRIIIFPANQGGNTYYLMDPTNWTCTSGTFTGGPSTTLTNPYIAGAMQPFTSLDAILLVDDVGANTPKMLSLTAPDPAGTATCSISPTSLPNGMVSINYGPFTLTSHNCGAGTLTWTISSGFLPTGLTGCSGTTGTTCSIGGTPSTVAGSPFGFTVQVTDGGANTATQSYTVIISPLTYTVAIIGSGIIAGIN